MTQLEEIEKLTRRVVARGESASTFVIRDILYALDCYKARVAAWRWH
jgi:hypothetical protein